MTLALVPTPKEQVWCDGTCAVAEQDVHYVRDAAAFAVNDSPHERTVTFDLGGRKPVSCRVVDGDRTDEELDIPYDIPSECTLTPHSIMLVTFE